MPAFHPVCLLTSRCALRRSNGRKIDMQDTISLAQLGRLSTVATRRRGLAWRCLELRAQVPGPGLSVGPAWARSNWQSFCVRLPEGAGQRAVMQSMLDAGIATRRGVMNAHWEPAYRQEPWKCAHGRSDDCTCLPESEKALKQSIILPLFHEMTDVEQANVADVLKQIGVLPTASAKGEQRD
ncbi:MAG: DegT/DnrJ/EryC1/StrS family aminotransferase [candidate division WOR-3 bacterium]|nr:DegT/DnrJ/EryC1/StrS family aminotransferase [candidate division WOR-3 bacterium]